MSVGGRNIPVHTLEIRIEIHSKSLACVSCQFNQHYLLEYICCY